MKKTLLFLLTLFSCLSIKAQCWKTIAAGYSHTAAVKTDGTLWTWGSNDQGQLGNSIVATENIPTKMGTANDWKTVAAGWGHTVALKKDGSLWAWGYGGLGQIGNGSNTTNFNPPQQIGSENNWQTIVTGHGHTVALKTDGTLWACGNNFSGQLGIGSTFDKNTLTQVGTDTNWQTIAAGQLHTVALKKDGTLWAWGKNTLGAVGDGTTTNRRSPIQIGTDTNWKTIAAGSNHTIAIKTDGTLWIWGDNTSGALGDGTTTSKIVPTQIGTATDWKSADGGESYTIAIKADGSLWAWGFNTDGELGNGANVNSLLPVQIGAEKNWQMATGGAVHTVAIKTDASVWTWGSNPSGQLGDATATNKNVPTRVNCVGSLMLTTAQSNLRCAGLTDGSASINTVSGGTAPYSYLWSNGKTTASITGLAAGNYSCMVTDATSLSFTENFTITQPTPLSIVTNVTNACNNNNGAINVMAIGGTAPYRYSLDGFSYQTSNVFSAVPAGNYQLYTKDSNGCILTYFVVITATSTPAPTVATAQTFTTGAKISDLLAIGSNIKWYTENTGGTALDVLVALQTGTYYVSQTVNGCESARTSVNVTVTSQVPTNVPANGLLAYYAFNANANDTSGNGSNGVATNVAPTSDRFGASNSAYSFNGTSSFVEANVLNYPLKGESRTISGWFKADTPTVSNEFDFCLLNYGNSNDPNYWFKMSFYSKGYLDLQFDSQTFSSQENYFNNQWTFFVMTFDDASNTYALYINGIYKMGGAADLYTNGVGNLFRIGRNKSNNYFEGTIDDIGIWNRVLTQQEITALYTPGNTDVFTSIPDSNFEQKLIDLGIESGNVDGEILTSKINTVTDLNVSNSAITDLTGIQDFTALTNLYCNQNQLTALDVSKNTFLKILDCNNNNIATLDVSKNSALESLSCYTNRLSTLDVSTNTALKKLDCGSNPISALDVNANTALTFLGCNTSLLTTLDVSNNTALTLLDCRENQLTSLDVSTITSLTELYCQSNQLTNLEVNNNKALEFINCSKNQITNLVLSQNTALVGLYCDSNQLTNLNLKNGNNTKLTYLNFKTNPNLSCIEVDDSNYSNTNWATKKDATATYNTNCTPPAYTLIPDVNFENKLISLGIDSGVADGKVLTENVASVTSLNVAASNIADLSGIQDFTALTELICRENNLTTLDVSKNVQLTDLNCPYNNLSSLDITKNVNLIYVDCSTNQITNLDVTKNVKLFYLYFNYNKLTTIDVSKNVQLTRLVCISNQLTSLDVSKNVNLTLLACENNSLLSLNLKNGNNTILSKTLSDFRNNPNLGCIEVDDPIYSDANWINKDALTIYSTNCTPYTLIPDMNFENALIALGFDSGIPDGKLLTSNIASITSLDVSNKSIVDLSGIEDFVALKNLSCASNQLARLELSKNINLASLACNSNQLTGLDVSKNINLTSLDCNSNQLTELNIFENINLKNLDCSLNQLTTLDVSKNVNLLSLYCNGNSLLSLNLKNGNNIALNKTLLNFAGNPNLSCIEVEDVTYSNANWSNLKDTTASYNLYCSPYTLIPDDNFERALIALGLDAGTLDGKVLRSNIASVTSLNVNSKTIYDLTGIEDFSALTSLSCAGNKLTALDVSKNVNLTYVACYNNNLATLNVSKNVNLSQLDCNANQLTGIDVSKNVNLLYFYCQENQLSNLNVTKNIKLIRLSCYSNQLTTLDVSTNVKLAYFYCNSNKLTNLNISSNPLLTRLYCQDNSLLNLNLKNGNNTALNNSYLDFTNNSSLSCIQVDDVTYSNANWATFKDVTTSYSSYCTPYTFIPDVNFENKLIALGIDSGVADGKVLTANVDKLTSLDVSSRSISDLTGIQDFVALKSLTCENNKLTSLDITKNSVLTQLYCSQNQIANLDVSRNINLADLQTGYNQLKQLDVSKNLALTHLECYKNQLTALDLSQNKALNYLDCFSNQLASLDLSQNKLLTIVYCYDNQLTSLNLTGLTVLADIDCPNNLLTNLDVSTNTSLKSLHCYSNKLTSLDLSKNVVLNDLICHSNELTSLNLKNGNNKNFIVSAYTKFTTNPNLTCIQVDDTSYSNANWANIKDTTANYSTDCATYTLIPDVNFENKLIALGIDSGTTDGKVMTSKINKLTSLNVSSSTITDLTGIQDFVSLKILNCSRNKLTTIDLSKNTALYSLDCKLNLLYTLDISKNTALTSLQCYSNQLTALDVSKNIALTFLYCSTNPLTSLDISKNTALESLYCDSNQLATLDISKNSALKELTCISNQLKTLDVSNNVLLTWLYCNSNQLTSLDLSKNTALMDFKCNNNTLVDLNLKNGKNTLLDSSTLNFKDNPNLNCIQVDDITYSDANWVTQKDATASYNTNCTASFVAIPDPNFEQKLIDLGIDTDGLNGKITVANINTITSLDLSNSNIKDLTGIESFTALNILDCSNNQLVSLDLSKNTNLQILYVIGNPLIYINLQNGNNHNLIVQSQTGRKTASTGGTSFLGIPTLSCVKVDDAAYSNSNWSKIKEATTIYSETCTLGVEDAEFKKGIVYPNPTTGEINILNISIEKATVYNVLGQLVKTFALDASNRNNTINLAGLPKGVYYIYLIQKDTATVKKVIVE